MSHHLHFCIYLCIYLLTAIALKDSFSFNLSRFAWCSNQINAYFLFDSRNHKLFSAINPTFSLIEYIFEYLLKLALTKKKHYVIWQRRYFLLLCQSQQQVVLKNNTFRQNIYLYVITNAFGIYSEINACILRVARESGA